MTNIFRKVLPLLTFVLMMSYQAYSQVVINFEQIENTQNVTVRMRTVDKSSGEPIGYVSVYLNRQRDTVITNFAITDIKGAASIPDVVPGTYEVHAEIIGYKPFVREYKLSGWEKDLGDIVLEEDTEYIDAATITAVGNPIIVKTDTLEFVASAYKVGENAMLEDLVKKMPGMEVSSDGTVSVNGEKVDRITVGGKTFFFNEPNMALKNLPAKIVDRIKVIDKNKGASDFTGVGTRDDREKVMDVQLKEEYRQGWFGNAKLSGGSTAVPKDEVLGQDGKLLFSGSGLASIYGEKNQLTVIGNAKNADEPGNNSSFVYYGDNNDADELAGREGLLTTAQIGANLNSTSLKGAEINTSVNYNYNQNDVRERSMITSFVLDEPDVETSSDFAGYGTGRNLKANLSIKRIDESKVKLSFKPTFIYSSSDQDISSSSVTQMEDVIKNRSTSKTVSHTEYVLPRIESELGVRNLGKDGRALMAFVGAEYKKGHGERMEQTSVEYPDAGTDASHLRYLLGTERVSATANVNYVEPLFGDWKFLLELSGSLGNSMSSKDAFSVADASYNDYLSSNTRNIDFNVSQRFLMQYEKDQLHAVAGINLYENQSINRSLSMGNSFAVGEGEWLLNWAPYVEFRWKSLGASYGSYNRSPLAQNISPTLNLFEPTRVSIGNSFLRPEFYHYAYLYYRYNNPKTYSFFNANAYASLGLNQTVYATWFNDAGVRFSVPVNSKDPAATVNASLSYSMPFGYERRFKVNVSAVTTYSTNTGYQLASSTGPSVDVDNFDYDALMSDLWGSVDGDRFYSGQSGFAKSTVNTLNYRLYGELSYNADALELVGGAFANNNITRYSLDPRANRNVWNFHVVSSATVRFGAGWEFKTKGTYYFYKGYSAGFGTPYFMWDGGLSKQLGSIMLSLRVSDILNQEKALNRVASSDYVQDTYHNTLGRYILLGVTFNFGKMGAAQNAKAQNAMWDMLF